MREFYQIVLLLTLFFYSVNVFLIFFTQTLGIQQLSVLAIPTNSTEATITGAFNTLNSTAGGGFFNLSLILGDWVTPINTFLAIISFQGIVNMITNLGGVPESFMTPLTYIFSILGLGSLAYLISGRS